MYSVDTDNSDLKFVTRTEKKTDLYIRLNNDLDSFMIADYSV